MIKLSELSIEFEQQVVLHNLNLNVNKGKAFVLIGPSGQGKTTLLKLMAGLITPTRGTVTVEGQNWQHISGAQRMLLLKKIGMLFQKNALFDSLTCGDNIAFPLKEVGRLSEAEIDLKVEYFLEQVGIPHAKKLFPDEISGGMQKRLGIARALALDPEIIFYDDPTAGLDPITSRKIVELIMKLKSEKGSTIVAITNDMNRAYQMADNIGMVVDKTVIQTGNATETKAHPDPRVQQFIHGGLEGPLTAGTAVGNP